MSIDKKRKELDLLKIEVARKELEFKIEDRLEEIERLKAHIEIQLKAELKLKEEIKSLVEDKK